MSEPVTMYVSPYFHAIFSAAVKFQGRDWRRIKREMRKAGERVRNDRR